MRPSGPASGDPTNTKSGGRMSMTRGAWARSFLSGLGNSSPDDRTVNWVASWTLGENTAARFNPLATTQPMGADCVRGDFNSVGVKNYANHDCGLQASLKTVQNGYYPHIVHGLQNNDPEEASNAVELGTWGTGMGFVTLWRLGDHRGEELLSHRPISDLIPEMEGSSDAKIENNTIPDTIDNTINAATPDLLNMGSQDIARNLGFIALGSVLVLIAIIMAVRTYVPVQQVVKTVAAAAA